MTCVKNPVYPNAHISYHFANEYITESNSPLKINILILPDTSMMCLAAILEPMRAVNRITGQNLFDWKITTLTGESINLSCGIVICADEKFSSNLKGAPDQMA